MTIADIRHAGPPASLTSEARVEFTFAKSPSLMDSCQLRVAAAKGFQAHSQASCSPLTSSSSCIENCHDAKRTCENLWRASVSRGPSANIKHSKLPSSVRHFLSQARRSSRLRQSAFDPREALAELDLTPELRQIMSLRHSSEHDSHDACAATMTEALAA